MQPKKEFSKRFNEFVKIQNENNLAEMQVDGIYLWRLIRAQLFTHLLEDTKTIYKPETKTTSIANKLKMNVKSLCSCFLSPKKWKQLPTQLGKAKVIAIDVISIIPSLVFTSKLIFTGSNKPIFISAFIRNIGQGHRLTKPAEEKHQDKYILMDKPSAGLFAKHRLDTRAFNVIAKRFFKGQIIDDINPFIEKVSQVYDIETHIVSRLAKKQLKAFKSHEAAFLHFFKKSKFGKIYLCWNRYYMPLLSAAEKSGIPTSEFQHGTITPYHIMYSWEGFEKVPYSPDNLLCFGPSWPKESNLVKTITPIVIGAPHLQVCQNKYANLKANKQSVVVFSQNLIGQKLLNFSLDVARIRSDLEFIFKPHPAENYIDITHYAKGKIPKNFKFANPSDDSYQLMANATYQIGVSSTTLNEGMAFGNRVIIVPFASWEYLENAIFRGDASLAEAPEKAAELLILETRTCAQPDMYYAPVNMAQL